MVAFISISTVAPILFRSAKASSSYGYGSRGVASSSHLAFEPPRRPKQTKAKYYNIMSASTNSNSINDRPTTDQEEVVVDAIPPLRYLGDKQLMQQQPPVTKEQLQSREFQQKLAMLPNAMKEYGGIGIAAPQVGWWARVFCFGIDGTNPRYPNANDLPLTMWINPKITWPSKETTNWMWEGCLSVPGMRGWVERPSEIILSGWDEKGVEREPRHLVGLAARIAQHELDHLDGILFPTCVPDEHFLVPQASMEARGGWEEDWPSPGSYKTPLGELCGEK